MICRHSTYKAIVDCLCNLLPEAQIAEKDSALRTQPERDALFVLDRTLDFDIEKASEAGVISRWLAQYPFRGADTSGHKKTTIMKILEPGPFYQDTEFRNTMRGILDYMSRFDLLRNEMVEHGLLDVQKGNEITIDVNSSRL